MREWVVSDLDGTLCDVNHRLKHAQDREWDLFHSKCIYDMPVLPVREALRAYRLAGYKIALCTGRTEPYRQPTRNWLFRHGIEWDALLMRREGDVRSDTIAKPELVSDFGITHSKTLVVLEDRDKMVSTWRSLGFHCFHVAPGAF